MKLVSRAGDALAGNASWRGSEPLWKTVPTRDESGAPLSDFMMLAPGLKRKPPDEIDRVLRLIRDVLERFADVVVFADFNLTLNLLWVSLRARPGAMSVLVAALRARVPSLKLVGHQPMEGLA